MRRINSKRLKQYLEELEKNGVDAKKNLHQNSKVSMAWINQASSGRYKSEPGRVIRSAVSAATGISEDELFPLVEGTEDKAS